LNKGRGIVAGRPIQRVCGADAMLFGVGAFNRVRT
jgi:hypothetical protein